MAKSVKGPLKGTVTEPVSAETGMFFVRWDAFPDHQIPYRADTVGKGIYPLNVLDKLVEAL